MLCRGINVSRLEGVYRGLLALPVHSLHVYAEKVQVGYWRLAVLVDVTFDLLKQHSAMHKQCARVAATQVRPSSFAPISPTSL